MSPPGRLGPPVPYIKHTAYVLRSEASNRQHWGLFQCRLSMAPSRSLPASFAKRLLATRQALGLTQVELERQLNLPYEVGQTRGSRYE